MARLYLDWFSHPPRGRSGGILLGVNSNSMEVLAVSDADFHIKFHVRNKADNFIWSLVAEIGRASCRERVLAIV